METILKKEKDVVFRNEKTKVINRIDKDDSTIIFFYKRGREEVTLKFYDDYLIYIYQTIYRKIKYSNIITLFGNTCGLQASDTEGKAINHIFEIDDDVFDTLMVLLSDNKNITVYVEKFKTKRKEEKEKQMKIDNLFNNKIFVAIFIIVIFLLLYAASPTFAMAVLLVAIFIYFAVKMDERKKATKERANKQKQEDEIYDRVRSEVIKTPKERYTIDKEKILEFFDIVIDSAYSASYKGKRMQNETGPQHDVYIASGMANGLAGGSASFITAMDIMEKNRKATEAHHELGRKYEIGGRNAAIEYAKERKKFEQMTFDEFEFSDIDEKLIDELNIKYDNIKDFGTEFVEIDVTVSAKKDEYDFPNTNDKSKIDGSFRINLYDKKTKQLLAKGYYIANNRSGNDKSKAGYNTTEQKKTVILKKQYDTKINSDIEKNYIITVTEPNLWLLKL